MSFRIRDIRKESFKFIRLIVNLLATEPNVLKVKQEIFQTYAGCSLEQKNSLPLFYDKGANLSVLVDLLNSINEIILRDDMALIKFDLLQQLFTFLADRIRTRESDGVLTALASFASFENGEAKKK